jgi:hypothetical protein
MSCKLVLARLRFVQGHENWIIDGWKCVILSDETNINKINSHDRSWCWIGDGECFGPQHVHETVKHGGGRIGDDLGMHDGFWAGSMVHRVFNRAKGPTRQRTNECFTYIMPFNTYNLPSMPHNLLYFMQMV